MAEIRKRGRYAWDVVNDMELPLDFVKKARKEEIVVTNSDPGR